MKWSFDYAIHETNLDKSFCLRQNMNMLITEHAVITPHKTARVRAVAASTATLRPATLVQTTATVQPVVQVKPVAQVNPIKRQNLLLLTLVMLPLVGAVYNLLTYGILR
jgi:hypothetical protein